jgi:hypothetical protein
MAEALYFARDSKLFIEFDGVFWEIPVLDGFSFTQATNATEITLNEMESTAGVSRRGRRAFNDSLAPVEWSFSTYIRPFKSTGTGTGKADDTANVHHAVEEVLWALFTGADNYDTTNFDFDRTIPSGQVTTPDTTDMNIAFTSSNVSTLGTANIYFILGNTNKQVYKITQAVVNEATVDFEIDGIATINWSGFGAQIVDMWNDTIEKASTPDGASDNTNDSTAVAANNLWLDSSDEYRPYIMADASSTTTTHVYEDIEATDNFIRNRLTVLDIQPDTTVSGQSGLETSYNMTLTGGSVTFSNNITYITPEELGTVNLPVGHVTGTRSISGNFTCYLNRDDTYTNDQVSANFFEDMKGIYSVITNESDLTFKIGGASGTPRLEINLPTCHVEIPSHSIEDVISLETTFQALPSTITSADEAAIVYVGAAN